MVVSKEITTNHSSTTLSTPAELLQAHTRVSPALSGRYDAGLYRANRTRADLPDAVETCGRLESLYRPWSDAAGDGETEG